MKLHVTGFVAVDAGSVASANAVLLRGLVERGHLVDFYTKPSFVDPRPAVQDSSDSFRMIDCTNLWADGMRRRNTSNGQGLWGHLWSQMDSTTYNRRLVRSMRLADSSGLDLWLGDWARGRSTRPVISFVQGPPGTDARSVFTQKALIERLGGRSSWFKFAAAARWRLGPGLPPMRFSNHVIVGSEWSRRTLIQRYHLPVETTHVLPYPIDLDAFRPSRTRRSIDGPLRLLWLGRFAPRKRLDLFLDGLAAAIRAGCDAEGWVVGQSAFVGGFERLLDEFPFPERLRHWPSVPRTKIASMLSEVDVMAQPSDEENFGSSVAEALACGVPAIVGATNGTKDYLCDRSICLEDSQTHTFAAAVALMAQRKRDGQLVDSNPSRETAERWFEPSSVIERLVGILNDATQGALSRRCK